MTSDDLSRAIQLILAPVVMVSAAAIFASGLLTRYAVVNDRVRALVGERFHIVTGAATERASRERIGEIDGQLPVLLHRHRLIHNALLAVYSAILALVISMCISAITAPLGLSWIPSLVFAVFVVGLLLFLVSVVITVMEVRGSDGALRYEVRRVTGVKPRDSD